MTIDHTEHFPRQELQCRGENCCNHACLMDEEFADDIETVRTWVDYPVFVDSGYRCQKHDQDVRGERNHPTGKAIDLRFRDLNEMLNFMGKLILKGFRRFGYSFTGLWLHVDRVDFHPTPAVWIYAAGVKSEGE